MTISQQLRATRDALNAWALANKGKAYLALDMCSLFEILSTQPGGFRVAVHWVAEAKEGEYEEAGRVTRKFWIGFSWGRSLQINTAEVLVKGDSGGRPMADLAEELREVVRRLAFDPATTVTHVDYQGMFPLKNINPGFAVDGIYLEFNIITQLPAAQ